MEPSTLNNTIGSEAMLKAETPDKLPSTLEELDKVLKAVEQKIYSLHQRLDPVSMRENATQTGQALDKAVNSHIHISGLVSRVYLIDEVLRKMLSELQV